MKIPDGLMENMDSDVRNPTAELLVSWSDTLVSGEWFRLNQSLLGTSAFLTSRSYLEDEEIVELITDADAKLYADESEYINEIEGYSELMGDSFHYATSDLDFELDNTTNRFTPRASKNLLSNPGFEFNKSSWNEDLGDYAEAFINETNVRTGIRSYQLNNLTPNPSYIFSNRIETDNSESSYTYSQYLTGQGPAVLQLRSFGLSNSGINNFEEGAIGAAQTSINLVSGEWNRYSVTLDVPSEAYYLRAQISHGGSWLRADDGQLEKGSVATDFDENFIGDIILPKKSVKANIGFNKENVRKFSGAIHSIKPNLKEDTVAGYCYDWVNILKDKKIISVYYENLRTDQLIANLASLAGIDAAQMNLEIGKLTVTFAWFAEASIWTYINQIAEAEGGIVFFDEEGVLNFYNRDHYDVYPNPVYGFSFDKNIIDLDFEISKERVKNRIEVKANPKKLLQGKVIYSQEESRSISPGETMEIWGQFNYGTELSVPALNVAVPTIGTGIVANSAEDGTGTNKNGNIMITSSSVFQESIKVNIKNNDAATVYITKFEVIGDPIVTRTRIEAIAEDTNSQSLYGTQILAIENDFMDDEDYAVTLSEKKLAEMKDPLDTISLECLGAPFLRAGDIVSVQRSFDGTTENFQIIKNRWKLDGEFFQNLELQKKVGISKQLYSSLEVVEGDNNLSRTLGLDGQGAYAQVGSYSAMPELSVATTGELTVSMWIKPTVNDFAITEESVPASQGNYVDFLGKYDFPNMCEWMFRMYNKTDSTRPNRISFYVFNLAGGIGVGSYFQDNIVPGEWIHVVGKVDSQFTSIYKNGAKRDMDDYTALITPEVGNAPLRFGATDNASYFQGNIDDIKIYNRALTDAEIAEIATSGRAGGGTTLGLIHRWKFDETSGSTAYDTVGVRNATLHDGATVGAN